MRNIAQNQKQNIDSVRRVHKPSRTPVQHSFNYKKLFPHKQVAIVAGTFFITMMASLATSQIIAQNNSSDDLSKSSLAIANTAADVSTPLAVAAAPQNMALSNHVLKSPDEIYLPAENLEVPDPLAKRKEFLVKYLQSKNSVLADHVDAISEQSQWKLIIAISRAESSFCKRHLVNNCWGIGGAWNLKNYKNYDEAIADVNRILEQHYIAAGLDSPKKIVNKWVGHPSDNWEAAVQEELDNLKNVD